MIKKVCVLLLISIFCVSCSIKYDSTVEASDVVPEFVFEETLLSRYEDRQIQVQVFTGKMEDYKHSNENFAKDVEFTAYDDQKEVTTEGKCGYLYADTDAKIYRLYDDIELNSVSEKTKFYADSLQWNENTEQLVSGEKDVVEIVKEDTVMSGTGFSASGVSKTFQFTGSVSGDIQTK